MTEKTREDVRKDISEELRKEKALKERIALLSGIIGLVFLAVSWYILGFLAAASIALGWTAFKEGNTGTKVLGIVDVALGVIFFVLSWIPL